MQEVHVPLEVFEWVIIILLCFIYRNMNCSAIWLLLFLWYMFSRYIDEGRNPQLYTKDCMEKALNKNEQVKGKIDSYRKFRAHLLEELSTVFPNETMKYRTARGDDLRPGSWNFILIGNVIYLQCVFQYTLNFVLVAHHNCYMSRYF